MGTRYGVSDGYICTNGKISPNRGIWFNLTNEASSRFNTFEGRRGGTKKEFRQSLVIALGSCLEIETQVEIAKQLKLGEQSDYEEIEQHLLEVIKMLNKMISNLRANS